MSAYDIEIRITRTIDGKRGKLTLNGEPFVIDPDDNVAFGGHYPNYPGCFALGDTFPEFIANAIKSLELWKQDAK